MQSGQRVAFEGMIVSFVYVTETELTVTLRPLHGIPILIKNNIATMDKMNNTGELISTRSRSWSNSFQPAHGASLEQKFLETPPWQRNCEKLVQLF
jgi:hypothetical protein